MCQTVEIELVLSKSYGIYRIQCKDMLEKAGKEYVVLRDSESGITEVKDVNMQHQASDCVFMKEWSLGTPTLIVYTGLRFKNREILFFTKHQ